MFACPGLDDTADAHCDNLVETDRTLCHDCARGQREILHRINEARKFKIAAHDKKEVVSDWARSKPTYRVALPAIIVLLSPLLLLGEMLRPFLDTR